MAGYIPGCEQNQVSDHSRFSSLGHKKMGADRHGSLKRKDEVRGQEKIAQEMIVVNALTQVLSEGAEIGVPDCPTC